MSFLVLMPAQSWWRRLDSGVRGSHDTEHVPRHVVYNVYGGAHPTVFKTFRNAKKQATLEEVYGDGDEKYRRREVPGLVVKFDPGYLPIVKDEETACSPMLNANVLQLPTENSYQPLWEPTGPKDLDEEYALAERQMLLWQERVLNLKKQLAHTE